MINSNPIVAAFVAGILIYASRPLARRIALEERDARMYRIVMVSATLHLLAAPAQIYVVDHWYHGITDFNRYVYQGALLGPRFDHFNFSLAGTNQKFLGAGSVSVLAGIIFAIVGVNKLAAFFVFGFLAFLGTINFYKAYVVTFPEAEHRRYALMIFFLPSLLFWTAGASKEAIMYVSVGTAANGAARILARRPGGVVLMIVGMAVGIYVRPQELLLLFGCVAAATLFRPRSRTASFRLIRFLAVAIVQAVLLVVVVGVTQKLAKQGAPVFDLKTIAANNAGQASSVPYHPGPAGYPNDIYSVLFRPLLFNAHGAGQRSAAVENTIIVVLILGSFRRVRALPRTALTRPYVMVSFLFLAGFCYAFAALSNLGLIDRERVLALPFLLVLLAIPVSPKGEPKRYPWEMSRRRARSQNVPKWIPAGYAPPRR